MDNNELLMIVLAFFLGFCFRKMMGGDRLIEGNQSANQYLVDSNESLTLGALPRYAPCNINSDCSTRCCVHSLFGGGQCDHYTKCWSD
tara:strand:- start:1299 stop:1562 length:264 start_codon:yes stop_codon:yes gene_type:complete